MPTPDYYTSDVTERSFKALFEGGGYNWAWPLRVYFMARKAVGWRFPAENGRAMPSQPPQPDISGFPVTVREHFAAEMKEAAEYGFALIGAARVNTIGRWAHYGAMLCNPERTIQWNLGAFRMAVGAVSNSRWASGLRTDLMDGTSLITGRGPAVPSNLSLPQMKLEMFPESAPAVDLVNRHRSRIAGIPSTEVATIPNDGVPEFLLRRAQLDFQTLIQSAGMRKLTDDEVERLKRVQFDFD